MYYVYWPIINPNPIRIQFAKDWINPSTGIQAGRTYYDGLDIAARVSMNVYTAEIQKPEANSVYTKAWIRNEVTGIATLELTLVGYKNIENLKATRQAELYAHYLNVLYSGITVLGQPMATNQEAINKINIVNASVAQGWVYTGTIPFWNMEGGKLAVNAANFSTLVIAVGTHIVLTAKNYDTHEDAISALTLPQDVINYDITTNWPANPVLNNV